MMLKTSPAQAHANVKFCPLRGRYVHILRQCSSAHVWTCVFIVYVVVHIHIRVLCAHVSRGVLMNEDFERTFDMRCPKTDPFLGHIAAHGLDQAHHATRLRVAPS